MTWGKTCWKCEKDGRLRMVVNGKAYYTCLDHEPILTKLKLIEMKKEAKA